MSRARVVFADGTSLGQDFDPKPQTVIVGRDFAQSNYCHYLPKTTELNNAAYTIAPMSSTKAASVPAQTVNGATNPLALLRIGPNNSTSGVATLIDGLTLTGTVQPKSAANPNLPGHAYHGLSVYWGRKAVIRNSKFVAAAWGDSNSPPGETFAVMGYRDTDTLIQNVDVDGRTPEGLRVGGSPIGFNGSVRPTVEDSYLHHSLVSSLTFSTAGKDPGPGNVTESPTTRRVRIEHNANMKMVSGYRFTGINHEHVIGTITHELPKISTDSIEWTATHLFFGSWMPSAKIRITVNPDEISGGHPNNMGALTIACPIMFNGKPNTQNLADFDLRDHNGKPLQPYLIKGAQTGPMPIDKRTHYVLNIA